MMPEPEKPHVHRAAKKHHSRLDLVFALSAIFVSLVSLIVAIGHGRTMEKMADSNAKLVAANSWPFIQYNSSNITPDGEARISLVLENVGIGPAKVESFEFWWRDRPMSSPHELLAACCGYPRGGAAAPVYVVSSAAPRILRPSDSVAFLTMARVTEEEPIWKRLDEERQNFRGRVCYCSVFDDCWLSNLEDTRAERVASCPVPAVPFSDSGPK